MKKLNSILNNSSRKAFFAAWIAVHAGIILFFILRYLSNPAAIQIDANLLNMLPKKMDNESVKIVDEKLTSITGQNVYILVENESFDKAKNAADSAYNSLKDSSNFTSLTLYNNFSELTEVTDFMYDYRFHLLSEEDIELIESDGGAEQFAENALMQAYSPFNVLPLDNLETDPFMLCETEFSNYMKAVQSSGTAMSIKDSVMASEKDGKWYVFLRGNLSDEGAAMMSKTNGVVEIYDVCHNLETDGTRFLFFGTPFTSQENSTSAISEISIITTVSMIIVVLILLLVFKSPVPLFYSVFSIVVSMVAAFLVTLASFKQMHILTLVFGTSLIGSCIDYSLHYFVNWGGNPSLKSGKEIRNHLMPGLSMAIISTGICFTILLFAPFTLLRQMATFCLVGLLSSYITTLGIYPLIPLPKKERKLAIASLIKPTNLERKQKFGRIVNTSIFVVAILLIAIFHNNIRIKNDMFKLFTVEGKLYEDNKEVSEIIRYNPSGWYIICGDTEEEALLREKEVCKILDTSAPEEVGYISTTLFVPSIEQQKRSIAACKKLMDYAEDQYEMLGFDASWAEDLQAELDAAEKKYISLESGNVPEYVTSSISSAWLGNIDGKYYTVVMPNKMDNKEAFRELTKGMDNVYFVSKMADMGNDLDKLTIMILKIFAIAYIVMFIVLKLFYNWKQALKIISIPCLIILITVAYFAVAKIDIEFFATTGIILVFGLGIDYIIYMIENENDKERENKTLEPFATMFSFVTTVISFGALALSSFTPVHLMGLTIFLGVTTSYISSMMYDRSF
ncbi:MAG: MMPL family transporter [Treponema sp.]|nr:MMPL family transporter [Treponema sp.]